MCQQEVRRLCSAGQQGELRDWCARAGARADHSSRMPSCLLQTKQWSGVVCSTSYLTQLLASVRQMQQLQLLASQQGSAVIKLQSAWRVSTSSLPACTCSRLQSSAVLAVPAVQCTPHARMHS
jgi:hypothetical protein